MPPQHYGNYAGDWLLRLSNSRPLIAIREGMLWILPFLLASSLLLLVCTLSGFLHAPASLTAGLVSLHALFNQFLPILIACSIGYTLATLHQLPPLPVAFLNLANVLIFQSLSATQPNIQASLIYLIALAAPLTTVPLINWLYRRTWLHIAPKDLSSSSVRDTLNMVLPSALTGLIFGMVVLGLMVSLETMLTILPATEFTRNNPFLATTLLAATNSISWFFGIHGNYVVAPFMTILDQNYGAPFFHELLSTYVYIGGSGATLSLVCAILLVSRNPTLRLLAQISIPISLFNVNEILLFGIPLILNPRLLLPFVLVPMVNAMIALAALQAGWLLHQSASLPFTTPIMLNAYANSGGQVLAVGLQLALLALGAAIYIPFVRALENQQELHKPVRLNDLDITFSRLGEQSLLLARDPISQATADASFEKHRLERIRSFSEYQFYLEYQPQVSLQTGRCTGCEALLRAHPPKGDSISPQELLQWLADAGLMWEVDLWVARHALQDQREWQAAGFQLPMSINVSCESLIRPDTLAQLLEILSRAKGMIAIELTEGSMVRDPEAVARAFTRLQDLGANVYVDDFGTGYSALSHLHRFDVDAVKIDRSFVDALGTPQGMRVLAGLLKLCHELGLRVVVEGVEHEYQLNTLRSIALDDLQIQGWLFGKAMLAHEVIHFTQTRNGSPPPPITGQQG